MNALVLSVVLASTLSSQQIADFAIIQQMLQQNFVYQSQRVDRDSLQFNTGEQQFVGDCDDYAIAGYFQLWKRGYHPLMMLVETGDQSLHTIVCASGMCLDNAMKYAYAETAFPTMRYNVLYRNELSQEFIKAHFQGE